MYSHISKRSYSASGVQMTSLVAERLGTACSECSFYLFIGPATTSLDRGSGNSHLVLNEFLMRFGLLLLTNVIAHEVAHCLGGRQVGSLCGSYEPVTQFRLQLHVEYSFFSHNSYF